MSFKTACSLWAFWIFPAMFDNPIIYDQGAWKPTMFAANLLTFLCFYIKLSLPYEGKH